MSLKEDIVLLKAELHLPEFSAPEKVSEIFALCNSYDRLMHTDPIELLTNATILASYAMFLTSETNIISAKLEYYEGVVQKRLGTLIKSADGFTLKEKEIFIRYNDPEAAKAEEKRAELKIMMTTVAFLSLKINTMIDSLTTLARARQNQARYDY